MKTTAIASETITDATTRRAETLHTLLSEAVPCEDSDPWFVALAELITAALLQPDPECLGMADDGLRSAILTSTDNAQRSHLVGLLNVVRAGVRLVNSGVASARLEPGTLPHRMLGAIVATPLLTNTELMEVLGCDETQVSRAGRRLSGYGLAITRKHGRMNQWEATPSGVAAFHHGDPGAADRVRMVSTDWDSPVDLVSLSQGGNASSVSPQQIAALKDALPVFVGSSAPDFERLEVLGIYDHGMVRTVIDEHSTKYFQGTSAT
jgi:hypothetical protein